MKTISFLRAALVLSVGVALLSSGCSNGPIAPNWYDSYYYKDGHLVVPDLPNSVAAPGPMNQ